jgi:hypothetical protein
MGDDLIADCGFEILIGTPTGFMFLFNCAYSIEDFLRRQNKSICLPI